MRGVVLGSLVLLAACSGGGSKAIQQETNCETLSHALVQAYSAAPSSTDPKFQEITTRMKQLNCP